MAQVTTAADAASERVRIGHVRWIVCALLFFATTINYVDRQIIGILKTTLVAQFGWQDERIYAAIVFSFQLAYAIGLLLAGRIMDRLGTRLEWRFTRAEIETMMKRAGLERIRFNDHAPFWCAVGHRESPVGQASFGAPPAAADGRP